MNPVLSHTSATDKFITVTTLTCQQIHQTNTNKSWVQTDRYGSRRRSQVLNVVSQTGFNKLYTFWIVWLQSKSCDQICHDHLKMTQDQRKIYLGATILISHTPKNLSGADKHFHRLHWCTWVILMSRSLCCDLEEKPVCAPLYLQTCNNSLHNALRQAIKMYFWPGICE